MVRLWWSGRAVWRTGAPSVVISFWSKGMSGIETPSTAVCLRVTLTAVTPPGVCLLTVLVSWRWSCTLYSRTSCLALSFAQHGTSGSRLPVLAGSVSIPGSRRIICTTCGWWIGELGDSVLNRLFNVISMASIASFSIFFFTYQDNWRHRFMHDDTTASIGSTGCMDSLCLVDATASLSLYAT